MNFPPEIKYTKDHEWVKFINESTALVGVTDFAQSELGDIVYVDISAEGKELKAGEIFGTVEAVKTVSDLFLPIAGTILEINSSLEKHPELINTDPYGEGWMIKIEIKTSADLAELIDAEAYTRLVL